METREMMKLLLDNLEKAEGIRNADQDNLLAKLEIDREERKAVRIAYLEDVKNMMEGILRDKPDKTL
jgi:hypothetical protein